MIHVQSPSSKKKTKLQKSLLVGGFNPLEKYARQNGNLPQLGMKIPKIFELPPPSLETELTLSPSNAMVSGRGPMNRMPAAWHWEMCKTEPISTQTQQNVSKCQQKKNIVSQEVLQGMYMLYCAKPLAPLTWMTLTWHDIPNDEFSRLAGSGKVGTFRKEAVARVDGFSSTEPREKIHQKFSPKKTVKGVHSRNLTNWYPNCLPCIEGQLPFPKPSFWVSILVLGGVNRSVLGYVGWFGITLGLSWMLIWDILDDVVGYFLDKLPYLMLHQRWIYLTSTIIFLWNHNMTCK